MPLQCRLLDGPPEPYSSKKPGDMWFMPWIYDPNDPKDRKGRTGYLAEGFWKDNADKRPPICVVTPSGSDWVVDAGSTNGDGWVVTGDAPNITCSPSIVVPGYHGFLKNGVFTDDLEGRKY